MSLVLPYAAVLASLVWIAHLVAGLWYNRRAPRLGTTSHEAPAAGWPRVAVMFAARDEAAHVEQAARSLLGQDYPAFEVIAVNDRSVDDTGVILDRLAREDPQLRVVHIAELPPGWLGKNHALQVAADMAATADWLLFTDADVVFSPLTLRRAVALAVARGADHVTMTPDIPTVGIGERLFISMFLLLFLLYAPPWAVQSCRSRAHLGIGAFNLVRATAFRRISGFRRLSLSVDDDMRLAQALKLSGCQPLVVAEEGSLSCRWQVGLGGMIRGLEKNFFVGADYRVSVAVLGALGILWVGAGPHLGLCFGPLWSRAIALLGVASISAILAFGGRQTRTAWYYGLLTPLSSLLLALALARSTWLTLWRGGVRWRDHLYPLAELRTHVRARNTWLADTWRATRRARRARSSG